MLLSICIPSYNRFDKLKNCIESILTARSRDFEIFVYDKSFPNNIHDFIDFDDERLRIVQEHQLIMPYKNCLTMGRGKYVMILLDKDNIRGQYLDVFLNDLRSSNVVAGFCKQNRFKVIYKIKILTNREERLNFFAYSGRHPSGYFFLTDMYKDIFNKLDGNYFVMGYNNDLYVTEAALTGNMMVFDGPLVYTETPEEARKAKSYTYSEKKGNIFFFPKARIEQFNGFVNHMESLDMSDEEKKYVINKLFAQLMTHVTIEYRDLMKNEPIMEHYGISCRKVSWTELVYWMGKTSIIFLSTPCSSLSIMDKIRFCLFEVKNTMRRIL